jgi:hypothetical protein
MITDKAKLDCVKTTYGFNGTKVFGNRHPRIASPLYYASLAGLTESTTLLLEVGADINAQGGYYSNAAPMTRRHAVVKRLLKAGADVDAKAGRFGNLLQVPLFEGYDAIV